jgi:hypothetical protein
MGLASSIERERVPGMVVENMELLTFRPRLVFTSRWLLSSVSNRRVCVVMSCLLVFWPSFYKFTQSSFIFSVTSWGVGVYEISSFDFRGTGCVYLNYSNDVVLTSPKFAV